jgi:hypothetical protein
VSCTPTEPAEPVNLESHSSRVNDSEPVAQRCLGARTGPPRRVQTSPRPDDDLDPQARHSAAGARWLLAAHWPEAPGLQVRQGPLHTLSREPQTPAAAAAVDARAAAATGTRRTPTTRRRTTTRTGQMSDEAPTRPGDPTRWQIKFARQDGTRPVPLPAGP